MTCDDAFDQLTMPTGSENPQLAAHLASCSRCRAMADTLAPAIELFAPASTPMNAATVVEATAIAQETAARLALRGSSTTRRPSTIRENLALLAAMLGGAACCFVAMRLSRVDQSPSAICPRKSPQASEWMERHALPIAMACVACHPAGGGQLAPTSARPAVPLSGSL
ncbi:hypothetical protein AYO47_04910 [Planctomyces sp. SCGC AG-212-M04]|nr:hypothetical protein AYO47_04910 [Planctomyces sp. SCGC AG-212-M04]